MRRHAERKDDQSKFPLVKFRGGWFLFAGGVGLSFVAALILRTVLSPAQIRYWVDGAIVNAKLPVKIEFKDVRVEFAEGWMPWLGLVAEDVSVLTNEACSSGFEFKSKDLRLSFSLRSLFRQQFLVHALDLGESQVRSLAPECDNSNQGLVPSKKFPTEAGSSQVLNSVGSLPPLKREKIEKLRDQFLKVLNQVQHDVMAKMESLRISSLEIVDSRLSEWVLVFRDLQLGSEVRDGQHGISMGGGLKMEWVGPNQEYASSGLGTTLLFESFLSPVSSKISISGNYKEGSIYWETLVNWKDLETSFSLDHQQLPLGPLLPFLQNQKIVTEDIQPKYLWLSCKLGFSGKILDLNSTPLWIEPCEIRGDIGRVSAIKWGWYLFRQPAFDSFEVDLDEIDLRKLMAVFQRVGPSGILSRFGYLNGHIKVNSPQDISLTGEVRDLEMAFSNRGLRGKQLVPFLKGGLLYKNNRISGILSDMELFGGEFKGQMTFNMDPSFRDGALQVAIDRLQFNESIQKLMTGGELNQLSIYGQGKIEKGDLRVWQGDVGIAQLKAKAWILDHAKLETHMVNGLFTSKITAQEIYLPVEENFFRLLKPLFLDEKGTKEGIRLFDLKGVVELDSEKGKWEKFKARSRDKVVLFSDGKWTEEKAVSGSIRVDSPTMKQMIWNIGGHLDHVQVQPSAKLLKDLGRSRPEVKLPLSVELIRSGELLVKEISNQSVEKIKYLGQKVLETARKIIPEESRNIQNSKEISDALTAPNKKESSLSE